MSEWESQIGGREETTLETVNEVAAVSGWGPQRDGIEQPLAPHW